ncbi:hypothetical protein [Pseudonocardia dioxanivorans]|uniref:hypothetical protein n=1 Tax=Pseudonocardia dioxanivorans TaxID=240495 RepID=UPI001053F41F|nr:hypothetical protein [Pseudonocardia dioxanivorans]
MGLLVAGYGLTASSPDIGATSPSVLAVPQLSGEREWADRAQVVLASVDSQLDVIAKAESEWYAVPASLRATRADALDRLLRRKAYLETQRTLLQAQLATYKSLTSANDDLRRTEQQLAYIRRELDIATDPARRTPAQAALVAALEENRRTLERRRDAKRAEVQGLSGDVAGAATVPLVDDPALTDRAAAEVRRVVEDPTAPPPHRTGGADQRPDAVSGRGQHREGSPVPEAGTGAPPDPGRASDDVSALAASRGPVERVVEPVAHAESVPAPGRASSDDPPPNRAPSFRAASADQPQAPPVEARAAEPPPADAPQAADMPPQAAETAPQAAEPAPRAAEPAPAPRTAGASGSAAPSGNAGFVDTMAPSWSWMSPGTAQAANATAKRAIEQGEQAPPETSGSADGSGDDEQPVG